jgi:citrate lyase beta subunit
VTLPGGVDSRIARVGVARGLAQSGDFSETQVWCAQGRDLGLDGKTLIHPSQIEACNATFEIADAIVAMSKG